MKKILLHLAVVAVTPMFSQQALPSKKITIYKNGTALVVNEGVAKTKNGLVILPLPDKALYGTYWVGTAKDNSIKQITFRNDTLKRQKRCEKVSEFLAGNIGKQATIYFSPASAVDKSLSGLIADFNSSDNMLKFKTDKGVSWMNAEKIYQVEFKEQENTIFMADSIKKMVVIQTEKNAPAVAMQEFYLQRGIQWIPSYFLKLKDEKNARLEMKALIENGGEAIENAETELVVGAPQLAFGLKNDPMTYDQLTNEPAPASIAYNTNARYAYKMVNAAAMADADMVEAFEETFSTEGEKTGDLYFYKIGKISLAKEAKGSFPIFAKELEYKHQYQCNIPDYVNFFAARYTNTEENKYDVFHSIEIKNNSGVPLTSAPVLVLNDKEQFLAQDNMNYTPVNASTSVRLSKAVDVVLKTNEEEINRNDNYKKVGKSNFGRVVIKGTITVENFQPISIGLNVTKTLTGEVLKQSDAATVVKKKNYYTGLNPTSEIKWELNVKPNEKKTLTFEYEVLYPI
jgi:hypothetical protein